MYWKSPENLVKIQILFSRSNKLPAAAVPLAEVRASKTDVCSKRAERKAGGDQGDGGN